MNKTILFLRRSHIQELLDEFNDAIDKDRFEEAQQIIDEVMRNTSLQSEQTHQVRLKFIAECPQSTHK